MGNVPGSRGHGHHYGGQYGQGGNTPYGPYAQGPGHDVPPTANVTPPTANVTPPPVGGGQAPGYQTGQGYGGQGYPSQGYPGQGYPPQGHPGQGYPGQGYPGQGPPGGGFMQGMSHMACCAALMGCMTFLMTSCCKCQGVGIGDGEVGGGIGNDGHGGPIPGQTQVVPPGEVGGGGTGGGGIGNDILGGLIPGQTQVTPPQLVPASEDIDHDSH
ncbi:unnamed protein product [Leptidea sinapis]|uniref:Cysteine-rich transmembrane CYSTM domain-containing protein n=1 Tax=Leptidea sinapis TaxID=189913 RepID=A0A5E4R3N1_9NEOP|nr:unnamed protein product [Leptidea sinapis]